MIFNFGFNNYNVKKIFYFFIFLFLFSNCLYAKSFFDYPISSLVIDAGHGGNDSGAIASYSFAPTIYEKDIVLDIALKVEKYVNKELPKLEIIQTRVDDTYLSLQERSEIGYNYEIENKTSSLYVSIHANSAKNKEASGVEIFTKLENKIVHLFDEKTPIENIDLFVNEDLYTLNKKQYQTSFELASTILNSIVNNFLNINNRGIKSEDLYVLNVCRTSACLIEVGFISNEDEAKLLLDNSYRDKMAKSIATGIVKYIKNRR